MATHLKDLLQALIHPEKNWKTDLLYKWHEIIGSLHSKVRIEKIYDDTLVLGVFHPCWMHELYLLSPLIIKTINEKLDQPHIKQIRFKHVGLKESQKKNIKTSIAYTKKTIAITRADEHALARITDPVLRDILKAFRMRCYRE